MSNNNTTRKVLNEGFNRLRRALEKLVKGEEKKALPQLVLQPVRNKTN